jgi:hypothetical protein
MIGRDRVAGVDFSGARNAGKLIWIGRGVVVDGALRLEDCFPASDLPGSGPDKDSALPALVNFISRETKSLIGFDFPFGLPAPLVAEKTWEKFIAAFPNNFESADAFRASCMEAANGKELKRRTDVETKTPFSAYNLRLYRQTYEGICNVLHPLISHDLARAIPTQPIQDGKPVLVEACPASLLKLENLYLSYKGPSPDAANARAAILDGLTARNLLEPPTPTLRKILLDNKGGDALDAVIAAIIALRARNDPTAVRPRDALEAIETRVFC